MKTHNIQTAIAGKINNSIYNLEKHFYLKSYNDSLLKQNAQLLFQLQNKTQDTNFIPSSLPDQYVYIPAFVISNQYHLQHNTLIINKGETDGIKPDAGIISTNGIVGVIQKTSAHYAKAISILNKNLKINVALKHTNYSGFLQWSGISPNKFEVIDLPANVEIKIGDTIVTGGMSGIFPKGIPIGQITGFKLASGQKSYEIQINSLTDMTAIGPVYVIQNRLKSEMDSLTKP